METKFIDTYLRTKEILQQNEWIKGSLAKDNENSITEVTSNTACKFCLIGALKKAAYELKIHHKLGVLVVILKYFAEDVSSVPVYSLQTWNDKPARTKEEVIGILDAAIEYLKTDE